MKITRIAVLLIIIGLIILSGYIVLLIKNSYLSTEGVFSLEVARDMSPFVSAFVGVFFSLAGTILLYANLKLQTTVHSTNQLLIQKSQFEGIFFNLISLHNEIVKNIDSLVEDPDSGEDVEIKGKGFFDEFTQLLTAKCEEQEVENQDDLISLYDKYFTIHNTDLGHYFRNLFLLVSYVDVNPYFDTLSAEGRDFRKIDYLKLLRAQLSNSELVSLALNGLSSRGKKFYILLERYELLKNINFELELQGDSEYYSSVPHPELIANGYPHLKKPFAKQMKKQLEK